MRTSRRKARIALWMRSSAPAKISIFFSSPMAVTAPAVPTVKGGFRTFLCGTCRESNLRTAMRARPEMRANCLESLRLPAAAVSIAFSLTLTSNAAESLHLAGEPAELSIHEVSERMIRIELAPLDERGVPRAEAPSSDLVPFPSKEKLRIRELGSSKEIRAGKLRVSVQSKPLSISARRADGSSVQTFTFEEGTNGAISFRTDSPVLGLGEGEQQLDRR